MVGCEVVASVEDIAVVSCVVVDSEEEICYTPDDTIWGQMKFKFIFTKIYQILLDNSSHAIKFLEREIM